jgi:hypothetical protein
VASQDDPTIEQWLPRWLAVRAEFFEPAVLRLTQTERGATVSVYVGVARGVPDNAEYERAFASVVSAARAVQFAMRYPPEIDPWGQWRGGFDDMVLTLATADLPIPPVPSPLRPAVVRIGPWQWSTTEIDPLKLYLGPPSYAEASPSEVEGGSDSFTFAHVGHGVNSYFLVYRLCYGKNHIWEQHGWGGAYANARLERADLHAAIGDLHRRVEEVMYGQLKMESLAEAAARARRKALKRNS